MEQKYEVTVDENGTQAWYQNGKLHREDGPAIIFVDGYQAWYQNDKRHRVDGPAIVDINGYRKWWYIDGEELTEEEFNNRKAPRAG